MRHGEYVNQSLNDLGLERLLDVTAQIRKTGRKDFKLLDTFQSSAIRSRSTYMSQIQRKNHAIVRNLMNGMEAPTDLLYLQVNGQSQLQKEIEDTKKLLTFDKVKIAIDENAIHRNEASAEVEPRAPCCEVLFSDGLRVDSNLKLKPLRIRKRSKPKKGYSNDQ